MPADHLDPRIARTRRLLQDALLELALRTPLEAITVAEITDQAQVNRSTFYQHYRDKETLLADALDARAAAAGADLSGLDSASVVGGPPPDILRRYTRHLSEHADLYRRALGERGSPIAVVRLRRRITSVAARGYTLYDQGAQELGMPVDIAAAAVAGSLLGMVGAWLESAEPADPDTLAGWIWAALCPRPSAPRDQ